MAYRGDGRDFLYAYLLRSSQKIRAIATGSNRNRDIIDKPLLWHGARRWLILHFEEARA